jgi:hypothetical protein
MTAHVSVMKITIHLKGTDPEKIMEVMNDLGWEPMIGESDFAYEWDKNILDESNFKEYCDNIMTVQKKLKELDISYNLSTFEKEKENFKKIGRK